VAAAFASAVSALAGEGLDAYVSIKLPPLAFDVGLLGMVLEPARASGILVHFDSLGPETATRTFEVIRQTVPMYPRLGCTLPGRWRRSIEDLDTAVRLGLHVRVVKGQWEDPEDPTRDLREGFMEVIRGLAGRARMVSVATHDAALAQQALEVLIAAGTPCGLEVLYGLPVKAVLTTAKRLGVPVRAYVPYGHGWLPYSLSQVRRTPMTVWWMIHDLTTGGFRWDQEVGEPGRPLQP
jgi:proline dehydrogenase